MQLKEGQGLRASALAGEPCDCLLVQVDALYPDGVPIGETPPHEENEGWRCVGTIGPPDVYSLEDLPPGFIKKLHSKDSGSAHLSISSAIMIKGSENKPSTSSSGKGGKENRIIVSPGATLNISRGNKKEKQAVEGERRLASAGPGDPQGDHTLLVVRITSGRNSPTDSAAQISDDVFRDRVNLVSTLHYDNAFLFGTTKAHTYIANSPLAYNRDPSILLVRAISLISCRLQDPTATTTLAAP